MSNLIVMVGLPGSGKSTNAKKMFNNENSVVLSSDEYREKMFGDANDQEHNAEVFKALYEDMRKYLLSGSDVVIDATNTTLKTRKRVLDELGEARNSVSRVIAWVVNTRVEDCILFDSLRKRTVGKDVIKKFEASFQFPQKFEGFDEIWIGDNPDSFSLHYDVSALNAVKDIMANFNQHNPHHLYNLKEHCKRVAEQGQSFSEYLAGYLHDVGKLMTQIFDENGIAHYYNHDSVGTYYLASHPYIVAANSYDEFLEVLFLVNYHMRAHRDIAPGTKAELKYRKIFGDDKYDKLMRFAEYDKIASGTYTTVK